MQASQQACRNRFRQQHGSVWAVSYEPFTASERSCRWRVTRATGEAYTLAHHLTVDGASRSLMIAALRYGDTFAKKDGTWLFAERMLYVDWTEERAL